MEQENLGTSNLWALVTSAGLQTLEHTKWALSSLPSAQAWELGGSCQGELGMPLEGFLLSNFREIPGVQAEGTMCCRKNLWINTSGMTHEHGLGQLGSSLHWVNTILKTSKIALTSYRQAQKCTQLSKQLKTVKKLGTYFWVLISVKLGLNTVLQVSLKPSIKSSPNFCELGENVHIYAFGGVLWISSSTASGIPVALWPGKARGELLDFCRQGVGQHLLWWLLCPGG